jgi:hypothetical protein
MSFRFSKKLIFIILVTAINFTACARAAEPTGDNPDISTLPAPPAAVPQDDSFPEIPIEARISTRPGDPRPAGYWAVWNTCAPDNRADVAEANGGRQAGWFLMDDLLASPGVQLGNYPVSTCKEGLAVLQGRTTEGTETDDPLYELASQMLAAELNLNVGAETCPIAEESVVGGHLVLSQVGFNGEGEYAVGPSSEIASAIPRLVELLSGYNSGLLCR